MSVTEPPPPPCSPHLSSLCDKSAEQLFDIARAGWVFVLSCVLLVLFVTHILHIGRCNALPETFVTVIFGLLLGMVLWMSPYTGHASSIDMNAVSMIFSWLLNLIALPIIIFESGWSLRLRDFMSQVMYIMLFAIVGTVISVVVVATLTIWTSPLHGICSWRTAFAYASLISSVDPVSTLATFNHLNVDPLLYILVFGESEINDAVAITLFRALNNHALSEPCSLALKMVQVLLGSIVLGFVMAMVYILIIRFGRMGRSPAQAILFIFVSVFFTFSVAEWMGLSGIITVLFNSIVMGEYTSVHLDKEAMALLSFLLKQMSGLADTFIFMSCGVVGVFVIQGGGFGLHLGMAMSLICLVGRLFAVLPLGILSNGIKAVVAKKLPKEKQHIISWKHLFMMWHSGLRGGVSLVLVMELGEWVDEDDGPGTRIALMNGTFFLVVSYLLVFGSTTGFFLRLFGLPLGDLVPAGATLYDPSDKQGIGWRCVMYWRKKVMMPILAGRVERGRSRHRPSAPEDDLDSDDSDTAVSTDDAPRKRVTRIRTATALSRLRAKGRTRAQKRNTPRQFVSSEVRSSFLSLFGTQDPEHLAARATIYEEEDGQEDPDDDGEEGIAAENSRSSASSDGSAC